MAVFFVVKLVIAENRMFYCFSPPLYNLCVLFTDYY